MSKKDFLIGADPEFGFLRNGDHVEAGSLVTDVFNRQRFGLDGGGHVAEIRPEPAFEPVKVVTNIRRAMQQGVRTNKSTMGYIWKAGSSVDGQPVGGHIHFGVRNVLGLKKKPVSTSDFLNTLDRYLAHTVLLLEDPEEARERRTEHGYGHLGDFRDQSHGFEYRTPSSWLTSPYVAASVLALAKAVVWETLYNGLASHRLFVTNNEQFKQAELQPIRERFNHTIWRDICKFELYRKYRRSINLLHTLIAKKRNWFPLCGMKTAWAIGQPSKPQTTLDEIWSEVASD